MRLDSLRRFDYQATLAMTLGIVALVPCLGAMGLLLRNWDGELRQILYRDTSIFMYLFAACVGSSLFVGAIAVVLGINSAGERRNDKQSRSWFGFLSGGFACTLSVILAIAFFQLRNPIPG